MPPKYPNDLSIVNRVDQSHLGTPKGDEIFPICSMSKSFCGVVSALMAADGEFGEKGLNSTVKEALEHAREANPKRWEEINKFLQMLDARKLSNITLSQLLTHSSGLKDDYDIEVGKFAGQPIINFLNTFERGFPTGETHYSNNGFILMEEIINLASAHQSYRQELQNRVFDKANLQHTHPIEETQEGRNKVGNWRKIKGTTFQGKIVDIPTEPARSDQASPTGKVPLSAGGICSSINDLDKYGKELMKFIAGKPSAFEDDTRKCAAIKQIYQVPMPLNERGFRAGAAPGLDIVLRGENEVVIGHGGAFQTNRTMMAFNVSRSYEDLTDDTKPLRDDEIRTGTIFLQQVEFTTANYICWKFSEKKDEMLTNLFDSHLTEEEKREISENYSYEKREQCLQAKQDLLVANGRLPQNFSEIRAQIEEIFYPKFLEAYLNEDGVIDEKKVIAAFPSNAEIDSAVKPALATAIEKSKALLKPLEKISDKTEETWAERVGGSKADKGLGLVAQMVGKFEQHKTTGAIK